MPTEMSWPGFSISPSVNSSSASPRSSRPRSADELRVREDPEQRALAGLAHAPAAGSGGELHGRRVPGHRDDVLPRAQVDHHVRDRREALLPLLADEEPVGRRQEVLVGHRAEQAAEGPRQEQRPGAGVDALAGHVDERDLQRAAVVGAGRHQEVAGEGRPAGRAQHDLGLPALGQGRHLALGASAGPAGPPASSRPGSPARRAGPGSGRAGARSPPSRRRRAPRRATPAACPGAISSTTTEATTRSSRIRLRTESRKPPARTTTARAEQREPGAVHQEQGAERGGAQAQRHQREPVRVQHVPPDPGPGPPPGGSPAAAARTGR